MNLFNAGKFVLSSGKASGFKIDCDALTAADWAAIAALAAPRLPSFGSVEGVPRGGLVLAEAMRRYITSGPVLICDDVYTTGQTMNTHRGGRPAIGLVLFQRKTLRDGWVWPVFLLASSFWDADTDQRG